MSNTDDGTVTCPNCGNSYSKIGVHWARNSNCDFPDLTADQHAIVRGILFSGGAIEWATNGTSPSLTRASTNRALLDWFDEQFGVLSRGVSLAQSAETAQEQLAHIAGEEWDTSDVYEWESRTHPTFQRYEERWFYADDPNERNKRVPPLIQPTQQTLRVIHALRGGIDDYGPDGAAHVSLTGIPISDRAVTQLYDPFAPRVVDRSDGGRVLILTDAEAYFSEIGMDPLPGCEARWPDANTPASSPSENLAVCSQCGGHYHYLARHWAEDDDCTYPPVEGDRREVITALALCGVAIADRTPETSEFIIRSTNDQLLRWLRDYLGELARQSLYEERSEGGKAHATNEWVDILNEGDFKAVYRLATRSHPVFAEYRSWRGDQTDISRATTQANAPTDISLSPMLLRVLYAFRGQRSTRQGYEGLPLFNMSRIACDREAFASELTSVGFEPVTLNDAPNSLLLHDAAEFFEYIGAPLPGVEHNWPDDARVNEEREPPE